MKKLFLFLIILSVSVNSFAAGKDFDDDEKKEEHHSQTQKSKNIRSSRQSGGKDISKPRLRPQPRVVAGTAAAQPIIINNNNVNNNNVVQQQQQVQQVAIAEQPKVVAVRQSQSVRRVKVEEESAPVSSRNGYWDEGGYFGLNLRLGAGNMTQSAINYNQEFDTTGASFAFSFGYKVPYFRFGGELGLSGFAKEVPPAGAYEKEEDSMSAFTIMPQVMLDIDLPGSRAIPYIGFGAGLGIVSAKYDLYWYSDSGSPDKTDSSSAANLVYSVMAGMRIGLVPAVELNIGYRFTDYGSVELLGYDNKLQAHELDLGVAFKF